MLLESFPNESSNCPFILSHPRDYCLLLLGTYELEFGSDSTPALVETLDLLDISRVDLVELSS